MELFVKDDIQKLLHNKFFVIIGDSVQRSIYKDILVLHKEERLIFDKELRAKGEKEFLGDRLIEQSELTNGTAYREVREYKTDTFLLRFYFVTRIYSEYMESVLNDFGKPDQPVPDVVLVNSCLWDITRYGKNGTNLYKENIEKFCKKLDEVVPVETCVIWRTTLPVSRAARGGFLMQDVMDKNATLVVDVFLANHLAHQIVTNHKYDVLDMHFFFTEQQWRRARDGIHWNQYAHRRITNIVLAHISRAWGLGIPSNSSLKDNNGEKFNTTAEINLNTTDVLLNAYGMKQKQRPFTSEEQRYGGPIRSSNYHIFDSYKELYDFTVPSKENLHYMQHKQYNFQLTHNYNNHTRRNDYNEYHFHDLRKVQALPLSNNPRIDFHLKAGRLTEENENYANHPYYNEQQQHHDRVARNRRRFRNQPYNRWHHMT
ncbi:PC-esterase domain-containing protein 1A-like [Clavelina lepadiformis]|uniref:PC-esterase domain-containing protein 1A-like n=1 Tax=Clavelina lepadiformis TaxID=159417 RepID=UPI00404305FC